MHVLRDLRRASPEQPMPELRGRVAAAAAPAGIEARGKSTIASARLQT
jgi:hypothetical protein